MRPIFLQEIEGFTFVKRHVLKSFLGTSAIDELQKRFGNFRVVKFKRIIVPGLNENFVDLLDFTPFNKSVKISSRAKNVKICSVLKWSPINFYLQDVFYFFKCLAIFPQIEF